MKLSIITTVYKAENDLPRLLESMMAQKSPELEFFLIDNGSPDRCGEICREYAARDPRFTVYTLEENIGYIRARNLGIEVCDGDYIGFCDSDDYLEPGGYDRAVERIKETDCDFYIGSYRTVRGEIQTDYVQPYPLGLYERKRIETDILPLLFGAYRRHDGLMSFEWKHIFRRELLRQLRFLTSIQPYEDQIFNIDAAMGSERIYVDDTILYNYVQNTASITAQISRSFSAEEEFSRLVRVYGEKLKRTNDPGLRSYVCSGMLRWLRVIGINMVYGYQSSALALGRRFASFADTALLKQITEHALRRDLPEITFIRLCLKWKQYWLIFLAMKAVKRIRGA